MPGKRKIGGEYIHYHRGGSIWAKDRMKAGTPDGYWEWFRRDGTMMRSGYFKKGQQAGEWTTYDKKGKVYKVTQMKPAAKKLTRK